MNRYIDSEIILTRKIKYIVYVYVMIIIIMLLSLIIAFMLLDYKTYYKLRGLVTKDDSSYYIKLYIPLDNIKFISNNGILASEFNGTTNNYGTYYSSLFYKTDRDILLKEYVNDIDDDNMPFNNCNEKIAFIVNPTSKIGGLLYYDLLDTKFDNNPIVRNIIDPLVKNDLCKKRNELSLILVGVPANSISGIVLGDKLIIDKDIVDKIKRLFPNAYIINRRGIIIRDRSNIIKIDDFDDMAYNYTKTIVSNELLDIENVKLRKEIKNIISILKKNTSYFEQAKIFTSLGYKLPKGLSSKLSIEEAKALKEIKH